jgi:hypothetical protein
MLETEANKLYLILIETNSSHFVLVLSCQALVLWLVAIYETRGCRW